MKRILAGLSIGVVLLAGCGGDDAGGAGSASQPPTAEGLVEAQEAFFSAYFGDSPGDTYDMLSSECQENFARSDWAGELFSTRALMEGFMGVSAEDVELVDGEARNVTESSGEVTGQLLFDGEPMPDSENEWSLWVYEDGGWRATECESSGLVEESGESEEATASSCDEQELVSSFTAEAAELPALFGDEDLGGEVTVTVLSAQEVPPGFDDPFFLGETVTPQGKFFGVRYALTNDASAEVQPDAVFASSARLSDGERSWETADYNGVHNGVSGAWATTQGDEQPETWTGAGFEQTSWAVFDLPADAEPTALHWELEGDVVCFALS